MWPAGVQHTLGGVSALYVTMFVNRLPVVSVTGISARKDFAHTQRFSSSFSSYYFMIIIITMIIVLTKCHCSQLKVGEIDFRLNKKYSFDSPSVAAS